MAEILTSSGASSATSGPHPAAVARRSILPLAVRWPPGSPARKCRPALIGAGGLQSGGRWQAVIPGCSGVMGYLRWGGKGEQPERSNRQSARSPGRRTITRMGAWGEGPFDNDTAADWVFGFQDADQPSGLILIEAALATAANLPQGDYLDADVGVEAVAAAEVVAAMLGRELERSSYNEAAIDWIARTAGEVRPALADLAVRALGRVTGPNSELVDLWDEAGSVSWRASIEARKASLT